MTNPFFSVVIANYNYGRFLDDAISSVISQDMGEEVELIICDAGSTDNSVEIIQKYANGLPPNTSLHEWQHEDTAGTAEKHQVPVPKITWWCSEKDGGQSAAFNKGFSHAHGRFLTWLNADDIMMHGALKAVLRVATQNPECEWIVGSSVYANKDLTVRKCFCAHKFSNMNARYGFLSVWGPSSFFSKRILNSVGGVDENLHYLMDIDLWHKFYSICEARYIRTLSNLFALRQHEDSKMSGGQFSLTGKAMENRRKSKIEEKSVNEKYGICTNGPLYRLAHLFSFSVSDAIRAYIRTLIWRGHSVYEM